MKDKTVLFVDDEVSILNTLKRLLRNEEYNLLTAASAQEGLELLSQQPVDIVISDMRMPGVSGTEFLEKVKDKYPAIKRMIMSGYADLESVVSAINQGNISQFISKPWNNDALKQIVLNHLPNHQDTSGAPYEDTLEINNLKKTICEQQKKIDDLQQQLEKLSVQKI